jgi:hypothetical protein
MLANFIKDRTSSQVSRKNTDLIQEYDPQLPKRQVERNADVAFSYLRVSPFNDNLNGPNDGKKSV